MRRLLTIVIMLGFPASAWAQKVTNAQLPIVALAKGGTGTAAVSLQALRTYLGIGTTSTTGLSDYSHVTESTQTFVLNNTTGYWTSSTPLTAPSFAGNATSATSAFGLSDLSHVTEATETIGLDAGTGYWTSTRPIQAASFVGALTGNASTATALATPTAQPYPVVINVKSYGAAGNGSANDYAAVKAAVAAVVSGSTLYFPVGTYLIDQKVGDGTAQLTDFLITGKTGFKISGYGATIKVKGAGTLTESLYPLNPIRIAASSGFTIEGLTLDGNSTTYTASTQSTDLPQASGINTSVCTDYTIRDVTAVRWPCDGAILGTSATTADQRVTITNCVFNSNVRAGLSLYQIRTITMRDSTFIGNGIDSGLAGRMPKIGLGVEPAVTQTDDVYTGNILVQGCRFYNNAATHSYAGGGSIVDGCTYDGNVFEDGPATTVASQPGSFLLGCSNGVATNNTFVVKSMLLNLGAGANTRIINNRITIKDAAIVTGGYAGLSCATDAATIVVDNNDIVGQYTTGSGGTNLAFINLVGGANSRVDFTNNRVSAVGTTLVPGSPVLFTALRTCALNRYKADAATRYVNYGGSAPWRDYLDTNMAESAGGTAGLWGATTIASLQAIPAYQVLASSVSTGSGAVTARALVAEDLPNRSVNIVEYADNTAALAGGLTVGAWYRTGDALKIVH